MKADPRKSAVAVAIVSALIALPAFAAGYSSESSHSTTGDTSTKSSGTAREHSGSAGKSTTSAQRSATSRTSKSSGENVGGAMDMMVRADTNKDGAVTKDEVQKLNPKLSSHFDQADANHDGKLSFKEFEKLLTYQDEDASRVGSTSGHAPRSSTAGGSSSSSK